MTADARTTHVRSNIPCSLIFTHPPYVGLSLFVGVPPPERKHSQNKVAFVGMLVKMIDFIHYPFPDVTALKKN